MNTFSTCTSHYSNCRQSIDSSPVSTQVPDFSPTRGIRNAKKPLSVHNSKLNRSLWHWSPEHNAHDHSNAEPSQFNSTSYRDSLESLLSITTDSTGRLARISDFDGLYGHVDEVKTTVTIYQRPNIYDREHPPSRWLRAKFMNAWRPDMTIEGQPY